MCPVTLQLGIVGPCIWDGSMTNGNALSRRATPARPRGVQDHVRGRMRGGHRQRAAVRCQTLPQGLLLSAIDSEGWPGEFLPAEYSGCRSAPRRCSDTQMTLLCAVFASRGGLIAQSRTFTHSAAGNYAPAHALTYPYSRTEPVVRRHSRAVVTSPSAGGSGSGRGLPRSAALIVGDPQVGSASERQAPVPGTFRAPPVGLCGIPPWPPWPRQCRGEVCGSTRPAPKGRSP